MITLVYCSSFEYILDGLAIKCKDQENPTEFDLQWSWEVTVTSILIKGLILARTNLLESTTTEGADAARI